MWIIHLPYETFFNNHFLSRFSICPNSLHFNICIKWAITSFGGLLQMISHVCFSLMEWLHIGQDLSADAFFGGVADMLKLHGTIYNSSFFPPFQKKVSFFRTKNFFVFFSKWLLRLAPWGIPAAAFVFGAAYQALEPPVKQKLNFFLKSCTEKGRINSG